MQAEQILVVPVERPVRDVLAKRPRLTKGEEPGRNPNAVSRFQFQGGYGRVQIP